MSSDHPDALITVCIPALGQYALLARVIVAACATLEGFTVDELEDLRLLANEAFHGLREIGLGPIEVWVSPAPGELAIEMSTRRRPDRTWSDVETGLLSTLNDVLGATSAFDDRGERATFRSTVHARHR